MVESKGVTPRLNLPGLGGLGHTEGQYENDAKE